MGDTRWAGPMDRQISYLLVHLEFD